MTPPTQPYWEPNPLAETMERATGEILTANQRAFLLSLSPQTGLDFEAARRSARVGPHGEEDERITEHHINAQVAVLLAAKEREIERLKGENKGLAREAERIAGLRLVAEAEAQKLREALRWTMEFVPNPKTEPINPNYREDFERQYAEARKALGGS